EPMNDTLTFNLIQNAIDSLERSVDLLAWREEPNEAKRMKQAILSVAHGIELLLKERLRQVHPSLVWENVDKYPSFSARTVTVDTALVRLTNIGGLQFAEEDVKLIRELRDKRNAIEHFAWSISTQDANAVVGSALGFAVFFSKSHLGYDFLGHYTKDDDTFHQLLSSSAEFRRAYERHRDYNAWQINQTKCRVCNALAVNPKSGVCTLCGHIHQLSEYSSPGGFDDDIPF